jgi:hypothetical protein
MAITKEDVKKLRAANQRMIGGKPQYIRTMRNNNLCDVLEFIEANYPDVFADAPANAPEQPGG